MSPRLRLIIAVLIFVLWICIDFIFFHMTIMTGLGIRYLLIPPIVFLVVLVLGVRYIHSAYNMEHASHGIQYFLACMFGIRYPILLIREGKPVLREDEENLILKIGGPGLLIVDNGSVAVVENYDGRIRVLGPGTYLLERNDMLKDCTHLEARYQPIEKLSARSKDGVEVDAREIRYRFRISNPTDSGDRFGQGAGALLQYSDEAVLQMVYNRTQTASGIVSWEEDVRKTVETIITDFIRQHQVDYLVAPKSQGADPRAEIYAEFSSPAGKRRFREKGAELIWIDIGHFDTPEENVAGQRVTTWRARWLGNENLMRDYGGAQETGRAEAHADILMNVIESLEAIGPPGESRHHKRPLYLARIAQLLDAMSDQPNFPNSNRDDEEI